jgi:hypothetical protein
MSILLLVIYAILVHFLAYSNAKREAYYYDVLSLSQRKHKNLHSFYYKERAIILSLFLIISLNYLNILDIIALILFTVLTWDFTKDGIYFIIRNNLNKKIYKKRFKDEEIKEMLIKNENISWFDKQNFSKNYKERSTYFIIGLFIFLLNLIAKINNL